MTAKALAQTNRMELSSREMQSFALQSNHACRPTPVMLIGPGPATTAKAANKQCPSFSHLQAATTVDAARHAVNVYGTGCPIAQRHRRVERVFALHVTESGSPLHCQKRFLGRAELYAQFCVAPKRNNKTKARLGTAQACALTAVLCQSPSPLCLFLGLLPRFLVTSLG